MYAASHRRRAVWTRPAATAITLTWLAVVMTAPHIQLSPHAHRFALFGHLAALVVGFGAVLTVDWHGLLWTLGRTDLAGVLRTANDVNLLIWLGLGGLVATGALLDPDTSAPLTRLKLLAVLVVALNGLYVGRIQHRLGAYADGRPPWRLLARGAGAALTSQLCWWTATTVGFISAQRPR
jgi:hypothetical protein